MRVFPIPIEFIIERLNLSWRDVLWGYEHQLLGWTSIVGMAKDRTLSGSDNPRELELSGLGKSETQQIGELLRELASPVGVADEASKEKWLFLVLAWLFNNKDDIKDPLKEVESVYADFGYPDDVAGFVRYMPVTESYDPSQHSAEENESRLYANWKKYLDTAGPRLKLKESS
jgi:hypothetical protein